METSAVYGNMFNKPKSEFRLSQEKHTINAIEIVAEINEEILTGHSYYTKFGNLYREIYPLFCRADIDQILEDDLTADENAVVPEVMEGFDSMDENEDFNPYEYNAVKMPNKERRVYEILAISPENFTEENKTEFISVFSQFIEMFGKFGVDY